ncbi:MAG TPA: hypothetical protein VMT61_14280 [Candidatus Binataceae bacterium]|nr:hypothetical protein [Candidatus Binataceae bacterium]
MERIALVIVAAFSLGVGVTLWYTQRQTSEREPALVAEPSARNSGTDPSTILNPTPFEQKMLAWQYEFDTRTHRWYPISDSFWKYHCFFKGYVTNGVLECPGAMPPGIDPPKEESK